MTEADLIQEIKDDISHSCALPYNLNEQEIKRIIKRARAYFYDNYQYAVEDRIFVLGRELFSTQAFRATRQVQMPSCVRSIYEVREVKNVNCDIRMPPHSPSPVIQSAPRNDPHASAPSTTAHEAAITATIGNTILDDAILNSASRDEI
jgi:hypothetical protein